MAVSLIKPAHHRIGLTNYSHVPIPGTDVRAFFGVWDSDPQTWLYSLYSGDDETLLSLGSLYIPERVTPEQVARIAFLLDVEYADH